MTNTIALALTACSMLLLSACNREAPPAATAPPGTAPGQQMTQLIKTDELVGTGEPIAVGKVAVVHYTGWLYAPGAADQKGEKFDSSRDRGDPFRFTIGAGGVIQGWEEGVVGMQVGGKRKLTIPPQLGYGDAGAGGGVIPPNATLLFDIELLGIEEPTR